MKSWTQEIPTTKNFGSTKVRQHGGTRPTRPMMAQDPRHLTHSVIPYPKEDPKNI